MNYLKIALISSFLIFLTSCKYKESKNIQFTKSELIGEWTVTNSTKKSEVKGFKLKKDLTAVIKITDSTETTKTVSGKWKTNTTHKMGSGNFNISLNSDLELTFNKSQNHIQMMSLAVKKNEGKILLTSMHFSFKKIKD